MLNLNSTASCINNDAGQATASSSNMSINTSDSKNKDDLFIEDAIKELIKSRRILRSSYVFGYYLDAAMTHKKFTFEYIQTHFEVCTENLSQIIARPYLKTPKNKIISTTKLLKSKRIQFLETIAAGLILPQTPPSSRHLSKKDWKNFLKDDSNDDNDHKNLFDISIKGDLNRINPWIVDKKGRHVNLIALLNDMPELENNLETVFIPSINKGVCKNIDCVNPKAINSLSGALLDYCSIKCMKNDREVIYHQNTSDHELDKKSDKLSSLLFDDEKFNSDLQQAIKLSKRQNIRRKKFSHFMTDTESENDDDVALVGNDNDADLKLAIKLSLKTYKEEIKQNDSEFLLDDDDEQKQLSLPKQYKIMPYDPFYLVNRNELTSLFKNMNEHVSNHKLLSFEKKSSTLHNVEKYSSNSSSSDTLSKY